MKRIALAAGAAYWTGQTLATELAKSAANRADGGDAPKPFPASHQKTLAALCELIIPKTDTPGAIEAGVPAFVADMYAHWMVPSERQTLLDGLVQLDAGAAAAHGRGFAACTQSEQAALLVPARKAASSYQSHGFDGRLADPSAPFFYKMRDLVTLGYFTAEAGVNGELAYVPVPGRWDGDVDTKTWNRQIQI
ncbi:gluconate 2-dehydrogenase subunit 3 family protein [Telluria mixta]|uniref:Gluconate 2-dehydrogenase subunit 3 family protein n=1 Tax=Telluria mixta TaxID=34071 RepID=A0ABT2C1F1_9BURK|nr:gluconate 2-dehydrogenase subunit 3 family protein [Telluria mixta]MCS0631207.1 gluconate 2-dehydrogenase subunit 3 family protein [Telluria mixta]WEM95746.1 gluconate 2-dehydrogenase subunit 3 family protein [Telluria mixta]